MHADGGRRGARDVECAWRRACDGASFAAVRELVWPAVAAAGAEIWDGAARLAAPVFEPGTATGLDRELAAAVLHGLYWIVAVLAERTPLAVVVDDAQWIDQASAPFVLYLARRLSSLPVLLAVSVRRTRSSERRHR